MDDTSPVRMIHAHRDYSSPTKKSLSTIQKQMSGMRSLETVEGDSNEHIRITEDVAAEDPFYNKKVMDMKALLRRDNTDYLDV